MVAYSRREILGMAVGAGLAMGAAAGAGILFGNFGCNRDSVGREGKREPVAGGSNADKKCLQNQAFDYHQLAHMDWEEIASHYFSLSQEYIHMAGLLISSHPVPVRNEIAVHMTGLDENPALYTVTNNRKLDKQVREAAAEYMDVKWDDIGLTDSTTMGLGLIYNGVKIRPDQELLSTVHSYYSTMESLRYKSAQSGAPLRLIKLFDDVSKVSEDELVEKVIKQVKSSTRVLALTWVHSSTGLKMPIGQIGKELRAINRNRDDQDRVLLCVDGVHGFGVEDVTMDTLSCDVFVAGAHKWLYGPRGTGILLARPEVQEQFVPTIPSFTRYAGWGGLMTPGGFHTFEHRWSLTHAFKLHLGLGKKRVQDRIHQLSMRCKEGLSGVKGIRLITPMDQKLSSGLVCFDVGGISPQDVIRNLRDKGIIASRTPYTPTFPRLSPCIYNTEGDVDKTVQAIRDMVG